MIEPMHYFYAYLILGFIGYLGIVFLYFNVLPLMLFFIGKPKPSDGNGSIRIRFNPNDYDEDGY